MLMPFFEWMESLAIYGGSVYIGPALNIVHLMAMVVFLGAILIVDLRLLGAGLKKQPTGGGGARRPAMAHRRLRRTRPDGHPGRRWRRRRIRYFNSIFWVKMYLLTFGIVFMFTIRRAVAFADEGRVPPAARKAVGLVSIGIWLAVAALARLIMMLPGNTFEWLVG